MLHEEFRQTLQEGQQTGYGTETWLTDWDEVKGRIGLKLVGCAENQGLLERVPHRNMLDLALVCYLFIEMGGGCSGAVIIQKKDLLQWGITEEELFRQAERDREIFFTPECIPMEQMLTFLIAPERGEEDAEILDFCRPFQTTLEELPLYVITNRQRSLGASAILSPGLLLGLTTERNWADCFLLPSSIHEMIALPGTMTDTERLRWMVRDVNECAVRPEDLLSYSVYRYSRLRNAICQEGGEEWYPLEG